MKKCSRCEQFKPSDSNNFQKNRSTTDGLSSYCKECICKWKREHSESVKQCILKWRSKNKNHIKEYNKKYLPIKLEKEIQWRKNNPEKAKIKDKKKYLNSKNKQTIERKISNNLLSIFRQCVRDNKGSRRWEEILGYTVNDLVNHLEKLFKPGMSWKNYGRGGWEVDHKISVSKFNFKSFSDEGFKNCWNMLNIQPLWETENKRKGSK